jgi:hypothetical protein
MYISRLVKTRDPYPGLFQLAVVFLFFQSAFPLLSLSLESSFHSSLFQLYACLYLVEVHSGLYHHRGPIVVTHSVHTSSHVLLCHNPCPSRTNA